MLTVVPMPRTSVLPGNLISVFCLLPSKPSKSRNRPAPGTHGASVAWALAHLSPATALGWEEEKGAARRRREGPFTRCTGTFWHVSHHISIRSIGKQSQEAEIKWVDQEINFLKRRESHKKEALSETGMCALPGKKMIGGQGWNRASKEAGEKKIKLSRQPSRSPFQEEKLLPGAPPAGASTALSNPSSCEPCGHCRFMIHRSVVIFYFQVKKKKKKKEKNNSGNLPSSVMPSVPRML